MLAMLILGELHAQAAGPARHNGDFSVEAEAIQCAGHIGPPIGLGSMADEW
jgi:hypothetical protein